MGALNIIMVPSAFRGNLAYYRQKVQEIFSNFAQFPPYDAGSISGLNVWYVDAESARDNGGLCAFGCQGTARLLCCDGRQTLVSHARAHCGSGFVSNVLIVHNDDTYGGAGYPSEGVGTVSTDALSAMIGIHEIGHSLFGLADEYDYGDGTSQDPNCDNAGCSKWSDLIQAGQASCEPRKCRGGAYYSDSTNMMLNYDVRSFGAANERITCCKYIYHTGTTPGYCTRFDNIGVGLRQYCNGNLWRGRYGNNLLQLGHFQATPNSTEQNKTKYMLEMAEDTQGDEYAFVEKPVEWILASAGNGTSWTCTRSSETLQSGLYLRGEVIGDYNYTTFSGRHKRSAANGSFVEIEAVADEATRKLFFDARDVVEVPLDEHGHADADSFWFARSTILVVLREGEECHVRQISMSGNPA